MGLGDLDERLDALVVGELREGEERLLLNLGVRVLVHESHEGRFRLLRSALAQPEHGLVPDIGVAGGPGQLDETVDGRFELDLAQSEDGALTDLDGRIGPGRSAEDPQGRRASLLADPEGRVLADLVALPALQDGLEKGDDEGRGVMDAGRGDEIS
jgi:hypothetical protein